MPNFKKYHIFCDESSMQHRYTVIGAVYCHESFSRKITQEIDQSIEPFGGTSELKWGKAKKKNLAMYKAAIDRYFDYAELNAIFYHCIIVDNSKMDHKTYNEGDKEIGFNKMLFTLLYKFSRIYRSNPLFYSFLDHRTTKHTPERMRYMLNARVRRDRDLNYDPYRVCQFRKSHEVRLIQIADILTGAVAYEVNQQHIKINAANYKIDLMRYIQNKAGLHTFTLETPLSQKRFNIWPIDFSKSRSRR